MKRYIVLLRGINVGGHNLVAMKDFKAGLEKAGALGVATYIQSGNAVLSYKGSAASLNDTVSEVLKKGFNVEADVMVIEAGHFKKILAANPFKQAAGDPKTLHLFFCSSRPKPDTAEIERLRAADEQVKVTDSTAFLYAPSGIGRSKLAARFEKLLGVKATARNLRSVIKISELI